jgi:ceramide glucosyltransferase
MGSLSTVINLLPQIIIGLGLIVSTLYAAVMLYSAREFFARRQRDDEEVDLPSISVLKPLKGLDIELFQNLSVLCQQNYNRYQVIFGVAAADDPAVAVVRELQAAYPNADIELVVDGRIYGSNHKVSNLHNMYQHAKHDVIVIADSDIRVGTDYLRGLVKPLKQSGTGLVTTLYRARNGGGLATLVESLFINTDWCHMVLVARKVERTSYAFGATIAMKRKILDEIGGFLPIVDYLADDYQLGQRVVDRGYQAVLADQVLETVIYLGSWRRLVQHQLRWARTYRICRPGGYFGSVLTHATLWALLNVLFHGFSAASLLVSGGVLALRHASAAILCWRYLRTETSIWELLLLAPKDLFISFIWFLAFAGDTVTWSGRRFRVFRSGRMQEVAIEPDAALSPWPTSPVSSASDSQHK